MGKEIEALINHTELTADLIEIRFGSEDILPIYLNASGIRSFQTINATKQGAFTASGASDDDGRTSLCNVEAHIFKNQISVIAF